jgi:hypothetical protein
MDGEVFMRGKLQYVYLLLFFAGLVAGILVVQCRNEETVSSVFNGYFLNQYASWKLDTERMLSYVGGYRIGQYALAVGCGMVKASALCIGGLIFLCGMVWGSVLSISVLRLGGKGLVICAAGIFPQIFFYLPAFGWIVFWIFQKGYSRKNYFLLSILGFFVLFLGIFTEVYLNPQILQQILRKI